MNPLCFLPARYCRLGMLVALLAGALLWPGLAKAQTDTAGVIRLGGSPDSIGHFLLRPTVVKGKKGKNADKLYMQAVKNRSKLRRNVEKVYPFARYIAKTLNEVQTELDRMDSRKAERHFLKALEKKAWADHESTIRNMTASQGRVLIKLIYRETGNNAYALIRTYKNSAAAQFFFLMGKLFKVDLKDQYEPRGRDAAIEAIVLDLQKGQRQKVEIQAHQ